MHSLGPVLVNGIPTDQISVTDRGFQYGDGVFTTLAVLDRMPQLLHRHLDRLQRDCGRLAIPCPDLGQIAREAEGLASGCQRGVLKIVLTRGDGGRGYRPPPEPRTTRILSLNPPPDYPEALAKVGVKVRVCDTRLGHNTRLAGIKHLNRLEQVLARSEWDEEDIREGIVLDQEGCVVEGVMSNLFVLKSGCLSTPVLDRCGVSGVMRELLMETARQAGLEVSEGRLSLSALREADELFLTNSLIRLWPIRQLEDRPFPVSHSLLLADRLDGRIAKEGGAPCPG